MKTLLFEEEVPDRSNCFLFEGVFCWGGQFQLKIKRTRGKEEKGKTSVPRKAIETSDNPFSRLSQSPEKGQATAKRFFTNHQGFTSNM